MVPFSDLGPPVKVLVAVSLAVKPMSSVPILISPEVGKAEESANTTVVTPASAASDVAKVVVAGPEAAPDQFPVPKPKPPNC